MALGAALGEMGRWEEAVAALQSAAALAPALAAAHYNLLKRDVDATRLLYETLLQRLKEASIASALRATNIRVVDAACNRLDAFRLAAPALQPDAAV